MQENYNLDFNRRVVVNLDESTWLASPSSNILRIPLEREKKESGHTTSIVKYMPNSSFAMHSHPGGEEIFVLEGVFSDENGDYPAGTYIRNPSGSAHQPFSKEGCLLFVKLNQFQDNDRERVLIDTNKVSWSPGQGGLEVMPLHSFGGRNTALVRWPKGEEFVPHTHFGGEEILVLKGEFKDEHDSYAKHSWIRSPHLSKHTPWVDQETIILVKTGHLPI